MPSDFLIKPFLMRNKAEKERMCITEYNEAEALDLLRAEFETRGVAIGEVRGEARGEARGETKCVIKTLISFINDGLITEEKAAEKANMTLDEFRKYKALYS